MSASSPTSKVPASFICPPDSIAQTEVIQTDFFTHILRYLGYSPETATNSPHYRIRYRNLLREGEDRKTAHLTATDTEDQLIELIVNGLSVASVMHIRTDFNYVQVIFTISLSEEIIERVRNAPSHLAGT